MNAITPFQFEDYPVRVIEKDGEPWFVAADVCAVLGIQNPSMAVRRLDEDEVTLYQIEGSHRPTNIVNESGLYSLVLRSDKPQAKRFKKWVTAEVLPTIRKTGQYGMRKLPPHFQAIQDLVLQAAEQERRLTEVEHRQEETERKLADMDGDTGYMTVIAFLSHSQSEITPLEGNCFRAQGGEIVSRARPAYRDHSR
ncbi:MAG: Bro-N domain-containing protein [Hyphomicrobiales bacterium]